MNHVADYSEDYSRFSPNYKGEECTNCQKITDVNDIGLCEECEVIQCCLCGEDLKESEAVIINGEYVCVECITGCEEEGEDLNGMINKVKEYRNYKYKLINDEGLMWLSMILAETRDKHYKNK